MKKFLIRQFHLWQIKMKERFSISRLFLEENILGYILKKYVWQISVLLILILLSLTSKYLPLLLKEPAKPVSLDSLVPKGFVLMPIEINNRKDIMGIIGDFGVLDLYSYSEKTNLPETQVASALKVLPPNSEEGHFSALVPEKEASYLLEYPDSFYAVVQNPEKRGSKIYKKKEKKSLIVIEENF